MKSLCAKLRTLSISNFLHLKENSKATFFPQTKHEQEENKQENNSS